MGRTYCQECLRVVDRKVVECPECGAARPAEGWPVDALIGTAVGGKYRVLRRLDRGAIGLLYLAVHVELEARRALKVLDARLAHDESVRRRFEREARALYRLNPRHIVRLEDYGEVRPGLPYMALEHVEGQTLAQLLWHQGTVPPTRALRLARQVAEALVDAAAEGVLHRDLRPENVLLREHPTRGDEIKVLDFGIAKILGEHTMSHSGTTMRSGRLDRPEYVAPELWLGSGPTDARADLFSLGVLLFELVTGETPWPIDRREPFDVLRQMRDEPARRLDELRRDLPRGLAELVDGLVSVDPDRRPRDARELIRRIDRLGLLTTSVFDAIAPSDGDAVAADVGADHDSLRDTLDAPTVEATIRRPRGEVPRPATAPLARRSDEPRTAEPQAGEPPSLEPAPARSGLALTLLAALLALIAAALATYAVLGDLPFESRAGADTDIDAGAAVGPGDGGALLDVSAERPPAERAQVRIPEGITPIGPSEAERRAQAAAFDDPAGSLGFPLGGDGERTAALGAFYIDRHEVSMGDFRTWHATLGPDEAPCGDGGWQALPPGDPLGPARGVSFTEAAAYCQAAGGRLPSFEEWEAAARGPRGDALPWAGGFATRGSSNTGSADEPVYALSADPEDGYLGPAPVTALGASGYGVRGMGGNVSEWVTGPAGRGDRPPYFHRGGSFLAHPVFSYAYAYQLLGDACASHPTVGFRCARSEAE